MQLDQQNGDEHKRRNLFCDAHLLTSKTFGDIKIDYLYRARCDYDGNIK